MGNLSSLYTSSVGKKFVVGLTGLFLCSFLVVHLVGNFSLFRTDGGLAFNAYSEFMSHNPVIRTMEIVLFAGFLGHMIVASVLWFYNRNARPVRYEANKPDENSALASRTMFITGSIVFIFLVIHLRTFFVPSRFFAAENPSMYELVRVAFQSPIYSGFYVIAMALLGFHLRHGFQSAFQTFGIKHQKYAPLIEGVAVIFWFLIPALFAAMPIYFLLFV